MCSDESLTPPPEELAHVNLSGAHTVRDVILCNILTSGPWQCREGAASVVFD